MDGNGRQPVFDWHTCDNRLEVFINSWMQEALREQCNLDDPSVETKVDIWFGSGVLSAGRGLYNRS